MLEIIGLAGMLLIGGIVLSVVFVVGVLLKVLFKLLLIPVALAAWFLKALFGLIAVVVALIVAGPVVLGVGIVLLLPLLLLAGLIWGAASLFATA